jgi:hypothetical protein
MHTAPAPRRADGLPMLPPRAHFSSPLGITAARGDVALMRRALKGMVSEGDVDSALVVAATLGLAGVVRELLQDGRARPASYRSGCLRWAALRGHAGVVRLLLRDGRANDTAYTDALFFIVMRDKTSELRALREQLGTDLAFADNLLLRTAVAHRAIGCVRILLECAEVDPNANDGEALLNATMSGDIAIVEELLRLDEARVRVTAVHVAHARATLPTSVSMRVASRCARRRWSRLRVALHVASLYRAFCRAYYAPPSGGGYLAARAGVYRADAASTTDAALPTSAIPTSVG